MKREYFGTDGIRGKVGESLINPEFVQKLGWAAGSVLGGHGCKIIIGKDTRISGYVLESALEAGLAAAGVNVRMVGPMPTPAIAYLTRAFRAKASVVISASHNPFYDNGIKFFSADGFKLADQQELAIEKKMAEPLQMVESERLGNVKRYRDAQGRYIEFCKSTFGSFHATLQGLKIVVDCANGATYHVGPRVFQELGAEVIALNIYPDGFNINERCGATDTRALQRVVLGEGADLGIAFDGDGDRVIMVDHKGEEVDGDEMLFLIANHDFASGRLQGGVVGTVMSNLGFELALKERDIGFCRAQVGDRYVLELMQQKGWQLGGETSGHVVHLGITTTGDGIITALQVLSVVAETGKTLHELKQNVNKFPQVLVNVKINKKVDIDKNSKIVAAVKGVEKKLAGKGRVLLRPSGTEPLIRVMVEGEDEAAVNSYAQELADVVEKSIP